MPQAALVPAEILTLPQPRQPLVLLPRLAPENDIRARFAEENALCTDDLATFPTIGELSAAYVAAAAEILQQGNGYEKKRAADLTIVAQGLERAERNITDLYAAALSALMKHRLRLTAVYLEPIDTAPLLDPALSSLGASAFAGDADKRADLRIVHRVFAQLPQRCQQLFHYGYNNI